jgi:hypothetical protein
MRLRFLGKNSVPGDSPTLYATDRDTYVVHHLAKDGLHGAIANWAPPIVHVTGEGTYIVQGKRVADAEARAQIIISGFEDCVEVTRSAIIALLLEEDNLGINHE